MRSSQHTRRLRGRGIVMAAVSAVALIGSLLVANPVQALSDTGTGGVFVPSTGRLLDTNKGTGGYSTPMEAGKYRTIKVAGLAGLPDDGSVGAVSLNATVGSAPTNGTLFGRPDANTSRTTMLIYHDTPGAYNSNSATIAVGADGTLQVMTETSARLILDVQGYYTANADGTAAGGFVPVAGKRIVDTRAGIGAPKATLGPGKSIDVQVGGANGVPTNASAVAVNFIALNPNNADGYLSAYETGGTKPSNSLHYAPQENTTIQAQVPLSDTGKMTILNSSTTVNLVVDLQGYFTAAGKTGSVFTPAASGRIYDSRPAANNTPLANNETRSIQIAGKGGVPVMGSGITAVALTVIVYHGGSDGYADIWPDGTTKPATTAINFQNDEIVTNTVIVALGSNGKISLRNAADETNYFLEVQGWYSTPKSAAISCPSEYRNQGVVAIVPTSAVDCSVTAGIADHTNQELLVAVDGVDQPAIKLSATAATKQTVTIPNIAGSHSIEAAIMDGDASTAVGYDITLGDWRLNDYSSDISNPEVVAMAPTLPIPMGSTPLPADAALRYSIFASTDATAAPIATSDWLYGSWDVPSGTLQDATTYYWGAEIQGTYDYTGSQDTITTPRRAITTSSTFVPDTTAAPSDADGEGEAVAVSKLGQMTTFGACNTSKYYNEVVSSSKSSKNITPLFNGVNKTSRAQTFHFSVQQSGSISASVTGTVEGGVSVGVATAKASVSQTIQGSVSWNTTIGTDPVASPHKTIYAQLRTTVYNVKIERAHYNGRCVRSVIKSGTLKAPSTIGWSVWEK